MNKKSILFVLVASMLLLSTINTVSCSYLDIQVYYNDVLYPGTSTQKPLVKIGEPFTLRFDITAEQYCKMYVGLSDLSVHNGIDGFNVIEGPSILGDDFEKIYEANESFSYEWTLMPTDGWAGGSMPINFHYSVVLPGVHETVANGEFTAAYVTISDEYYDGSITSPESEQQSSNESPSTPAFTLLSACVAFIGVIIYRKYQ